MTVFSCKQTTNSKNVIHLSPQEYQTVLSRDTLQLIDVRTAKEYATEHIKNAENIDFFSNNFFNSINKLNKDEPVYIYCRSGKRSNKSIAHFEEAGFTEIYNLKGGILNWKSKGHETKSGN